MLSAAEVRALAEAFADLANGLERQAPLDDPWSVEVVALSSFPMAAHPDTPPEVAELLVAALVQRGDPAALAVLRAQERLAHPPLRDRAREAAAELARRGVRSPLEEEVGSLRVREAAVHRVEGEDAAIVCLLQRPSTPELAQGVLAFLDPETRALIEVRATDPEPLREATRRFRSVGFGGRRRKVAPAEALDLLERAVSAGAPLLDEMLLDLAVLERGLTGGDMRLPRPPVHPIDDDDGEEAEGVAGRLVNQMLAEGVDPTDPAALAAWMEDFNRRPHAERRAITDAGMRPGSPAPAPSAKKRQRRQAKASRKRNRRR